MLSKKNGVKRYILASSASIYGQQENIADDRNDVNIYRINMASANRGNKAK